jgi:hypothetical protein
MIVCGDAGFQGKELERYHLGAPCGNAVHQKKSPLEITCGEGAQLDAIGHEEIVYLCELDIPDKIPRQASQLRQFCSVFFCLSPFLICHLFGILCELSRGVCLLIKMVTFPQNRLN